MQIDQMPDQQQVTPRKSRRWPVVVMLGVVVLALVVLGIGHAALSSQPPRFTSLLVIRDAYGPYPFFETTVRDTDAIARLYDAALQLPQPTPGVYNCDGDVVYLLTFMKGSTIVVRMELRQLCGNLAIDSATNQPIGGRTMTPTFEALAAKTFGIPVLFVPPSPQGFVLLGRRVTLSLA